MVISAPLPPSWAWPISTLWPLVKVMPLLTGSTRSTSINSRCCNSSCPQNDQRSWPKGRGWRRVVNSNLALCITFGPILKLDPEFHPENEDWKMQILSTNLRTKQGPMFRSMRKSAKKWLAQLWASGDSRQASVWCPKKWSCTRPYTAAFRSLFCRGFFVPPVKIMLQITSMNWSG